MNTKAFVLLLALALCPTPAPAAEQPLDIGTQWGEVSSRTLGRPPRFWTRNSRFAEGTGQLVDTGGKLALRLVASGIETPFHLYYREPIPVAEGDVIRGKAMIRGEGDLTVKLYCYGSDEEHLGALPLEDVLIPVDSPEEFQEADFAIEIAALRKGMPGLIRFALVVSPGSKVEVQSLEVRRQSR